MSEPLYYACLTEQVAAVRAALDRHSEQLDEALLSNAFAWIRKCTEDRFDTMVQLIQKVKSRTVLSPNMFACLHFAFACSIERLLIHG